ncbi:uroporphyrinogen-III chloroplastic isoform X1 [Micractinium conductrix]|uniref:Uroporphyrinogen-III synthase n=1 Tax=Micractinium conductrix TaxID=554055 RepID=A0A2P6VI66_9CHLO|nr:uroporphyrinogen-III chloroplastic isoform X1 [Micractinium conductrix]|eukprot:PSC73789.1 uroporphyrinogen-III chloroplastic isoform X1 [Micractinium conductrix]
MAARTAAHCAPAAPSAPRQAVQLHACPQSRLLAQARAACGAPRAPPAAAPAAGWRPRVQPRRFAAAARGAAAAAAAAPAQVVLTREQGKNGALRKVLEGRGISCLELPMVETVAGPDRDRLPEVLREQAASFDWVCITSPEAASVFLEGWRAAGRPAVRLAVVGEGTGRVFAAAAGDGVPQPQFVPSVANAEHFGPELPFVEGGSKRVLYPASNKASTELQAGLAARGFEVLCLNTYDTLPVSRLDGAALAAAKQVAVVTVGSPSAIKAWVQLVGEEATQRMAIACIGSTSARAAEKLGLQRVRFPAEPGVATWAAVVEECLAEAGVTS